MPDNDNSIKPSVFVSYRRTEFARVEPLVRALEAAGIQCFLDRDAIDPLADFPKGKRGRGRIFREARPSLRL